ncbi:unnamed protein product [Soboliphyme baturini]|uniref:2-oxoacid dehydrogenase acyltransferase catalytic domain-containing protein n=1 Tax=Soboliphyme baturini TaxID=241478 RepID=A0A183IM88_9BILA|nr:unnamed protein product [Soboliphyme baturini]
MWVIGVQCSIEMSLDHRVVSDHVRCRCVSTIILDRSDRRRWRRGGVGGRWQRLRQMADQEDVETTVERFSDSAFVFGRMSFKNIQSFRYACYPETVLLKQILIAKCSLPILGHALICPHVQSLFAAFAVRRVK